MTRQKVSGFTLVEVLLVSAILVTVATLAAVALSGRLAGTALRTAAGDLLQTTRYAKLLAAQNHRPCLLHINLDDQTYHLSILDVDRPVGDNDAQLDPRVVHDAYTQPRQLHEKLRFARVAVEGKGEQSAGIVTVAFHSDGAADAALIEIAGAEDTQTLAIDPISARAVLHNGSVKQLPTGYIQLDAGVVVNWR